MTDASLERIETKLDALTDHVVALDGRLGGVEHGVAGLDRRLKQLDATVAQLGVTVTTGFKDLGTKVDLLERKVDSLADTQLHVNSDLSSRVQKHDQRITAVEKRK